MRPCLLFSGATRTADGNARCRARTMLFLSLTTALRAVYGHVPLVRGRMESGSTARRHRDAGQAPPSTLHLAWVGAAVPQPQVPRSSGQGKPWMQWNGNGSRAIAFQFQPGC